MLGTHDLWLFVVAALLLWSLVVAWTAARAGERLRRSAVIAWLNRCIGAFFIYVGIRLAFAKA